MTPAAPPLLAIRDLRIGFREHRAHPAFQAVDGVSLEVAAGRTVGLVGESGCGKTLTALAVMGLLPRDAEVGDDSSIRLDGEELLRAPAPRLRELRGGSMAMVFQEPMTALNPVLRVGTQVMEAVTAHEAASRAVARDRALELLEEVRLPDPAGTLRSFPHELSGGMRQRVLLAMALASSPRLLVADEPTTALDVTTQARILQLLRDIRYRRGMGLLLVTHDLGVVAETCDDVVVMYAGRVMERAPVEELFRRPAHPYTRGLLGSVPRVGDRRGELRPIQGSVPPPGAWPLGCRFRDRCPDAFDRCSAEPDLLQVAGSPPRHSRCWLVDEVQRPDPGPPPPAPSGAPPREPGEILLEVEGLTTVFRPRGAILRRGARPVRAVSDVSFAVRKGETLGVVGESGCGKTTLARTLLGLVEPEAGRVRLRGLDVLGLGRRERVRFRRRVQLVFQDPFGSLDPRMRAGAVLDEVLRVHGLGDGPAGRDARVDELLESVGLGAQHRRRFPHELSGGQRQRLGIARALAVEPELLVLDEPASALDVSVQAQILNLLARLQREHRLTYVVIAHDLALVHHVSDRVAVMHEGRIVEMGPTDELFGSPRNEWTRKLLAAVPRPDPSLRGGERG